jgi:hypothetical protein
MSLEDAKKFTDLLQSDPSVQSQYQNKWDGILDLAKQHGLNVSRQELQQHLRQRWGIASPSNQDDKDTCTFLVTGS